MYFQQHILLVFYRICQTLDGITCQFLCILQPDGSFHTCGCILIPSGKRLIWDCQGLRKQYAPRNRIPLGHRQRITIDRQGWTSTLTSKSCHLRWSPGLSPSKAAGSYHGVQNVRPYSPFLNIVEQAISALKAAMKADHSCPEVQERMNNRDEGRDRVVALGVYRTHLLL